MNETLLQLVQMADIGAFRQTRTNVLKGASAAAFLTALAMILADMPLFRGLAFGHTSSR